MGALLRRYRAWRLNRRIERILREAGFPPDVIGVFTGNVKVTDALYEPSDSALLKIKESTDAELPRLEFDS